MSAYSYLKFGNYNLMIKCLWKAEMRLYELRPLDLIGGEYDNLWPHPCCLELASAHKESAQLSAVK
jgi:hypothetical protein